MNEEVEKNDFRRGLDQLYKDIGREIRPPSPGPYEETGESVVLEQTTRRFFFDTFLSLLGWKLGLAGDVAEEARIRADTICFLDYVGLSEGGRTPTLIVEAKAWDKPFVSAASRRPDASSGQLLVEAIRHVARGGAAKESPVTSAWHDYIEQIAGYVKTSKDDYDHDVPRAVLASGQWLVIFKAPYASLVEGNLDEDNLLILRDAEILERCEEVFTLLSRRKLGPVTPFPIRPAQLPTYVKNEDIDAVFHAVLVTYNNVGTTLFSRKPVVSVYAALIVQRSDGALLSVIDRRSDDLRLDPTGGAGGETLSNHVAAVSQNAEQLLADCSTELGMNLAAFNLTDFAGFEEFNGLTIGEIEPEITKRRFVRPLRHTFDEWIIVTGEATHYMLPHPKITCQFHWWAACRDAGHEIGPAAIGTPITSSPRSFFLDGNLFHCAHQVVVDRRQERCQIAPLDMRTCCSSCNLQDVCWAPAEVAQLPCGS